MSEKQSQIVSVEACCVVEIRRFLSFEMSPDQVLAFVAHVEDWLARISQCAVKRRRFPVGAKPTRQLSLQPEAIGATMEATKLLKPSV